MLILTNAEREEVIIAIETALAEVEDNEDISQRAVDRLHTALQTLGVKSDEEDED